MQVQKLMENQFNQPVLQEQSTQKDWLKELIENEYTCEYTSCGIKWVENGAMQIFHGKVSIFLIDWTVKNRAKYRTSIYKAKKQ